MNTSGMHAHSITLTCPVCGNTYAPKKPWQRFCGPVCRNRFHKSSSLEARVKALEARVAKLEGK